jgi:hypothetical protein
MFVIFDFNYLKIMHMNFNTNNTNIILKLIVITESNLKLR